VQFNVHTLSVIDDRRRRRCRQRHHVWVTCDCRRSGPRGVCGCPAAITTQVYSAQQLWDRSHAWHATKTIVCVHDRCRGTINTGSCSVCQIKVTQCPPKHRDTLQFALLEMQSQIHSQTTKTTLVVAYAHNPVLLPSLTRCERCRSGGTWRAQHEKGRHRISRN
jgi:hypothetical protein